MPEATHDGTDIYYERDGGGEGERGDETVVFVGDAGYGAWQWGWQYGAVAGPREAVVYDHRGTGRSDAPPGPYSVADLRGDLWAVCDAVGATRPHLVGAGLGGLVALEAALVGEPNPRSLTLVGTAAAGVDADPRACHADPGDTAALRESTTVALSRDFCERHPDVVDRIVAWRADEDAAPEAFAAQAAAVEAFDRRDDCHEVTTPALVVHGGEDAAWSVAAGRDLADRLPRGEFHGFPDAGHLVGVERARPVSDRLVAFLDEHGD